jgi:hypothetical protein
VIVDLSKVRFIASLGIRMLVAASQQQSRIGGKLVLVGPDEMTMRILKTRGIDQMLPVRGTLDEALPLCFPACRRRPAADDDARRPAGRRHPARCAAALAGRPARAVAGGSRQPLALEQARRELAFARDIQASLLPAEPLFTGDARLDCVGRMRPARDAGGGFYDLFFPDDRHLLFVIADVCGKGLPAALFMVRAIAALRAQPRQAVQAELLLALVSSLNERLIAYKAARQFITAFCGVLDLQSPRLQYESASYYPPLVAPAGQPFA